MTASRLIDIAFAAVGLAVSLPFLAAAAIGIKLSGSGSVLYRARRVGRGGRRFVMYKLRTMRLATAPGLPITGPVDPRVFPFGRLLRATKIDELPQLWNVLRGDMALVGPRPEDPGIVAEHYGPCERATLSVRPGLTSPGTLYYYIRAEPLLDQCDPMASYVEVMRSKLAIDARYLHQATVFSDLKILVATLFLIFRHLSGRDSAPPAVERARDASPGGAELATPRHPSR